MPKTFYESIKFKSVYGFLFYRELHFCGGGNILFVNVAYADVYTDLVGDKDQNPPPDSDGFGIVHESDDPIGFDIYRTGGETSWKHDLSGKIDISNIVIDSVELKIATVGLIDQNFGNIDNKLFVDEVEIHGAFDDSHDGWRLYSFTIPSYYLSDGILNITLDADEGEGWGGVDYSELIVQYHINTSPPWLSVSPASSSVSNSAGTTTFAVSNTGTGTMNWTASVISGTWLRITSGASGSNNGTINCSFDANTTTSARTGTIRVTATGATGSPKDITVTQAAGDSPVKPSLTLSSASGSPSGTVTVNLSITNVTGVSVAAISTDIDFDSSIFEAYPSDAANTKNPVAVIGAAGTAAGKRVISNLVDSNTLRVGIYSENTTAIANGVVASITFYIKSTAINGLTTDLTQIPSGSDSNSNDVTITGTKGTVTINSCKLGDCDCNGTVSIAEVQSAVNMYLSKKTVTSCCDRDGNGSVSISEVQAIVNNYLGIVPKSKHATRDKKQPAQVNIEPAHDGYSLSLIPNKNSISAMSIDVAYPVGLAGKISFTLGASAELAGKELVQNQIQPGITRIGLIDAFDNQAIDDGEILFVHVDGDSAEGDVSFKVTASDDAGEEIQVR